MTDNDQELDELTAGCLAAEPRAGLLRYGLRRSIVRYARGVAQGVAAEVGPDADEVTRQVRDLVEREYVAATDRCGNVILLAVLGAIVQFVVLRVLRRIWPEREFSAVGSE
jgi:hypothetical protein